MRMRWVIARSTPGAKDGIQGGIWPAPPHANTFVQLFVRVDDVKISMETAQALGATVLVPATTLPDGDEIAILADPTGLSFGLDAGTELNAAE